MNKKRLLAIMMIAVMGVNTLVGASTTSYAKTPDFPIEREVVRVGAKNTQSVKKQKPKKVKVSNQTPSKVNVTWEKVSGAKKYCVTYYNKKSNVKKKYVKGTSVTLKGLKANTKYTYYVQAIGKENGKKVKSKKSAKVKKRTLKKEDRTEKKTEKATEKDTTEEKKTEVTTEKVTTEERKTASTTERVTTEEKKIEVTTERVTTEEKTETTSETATTEEKKTEATTERVTTEEKKTETTTEKATTEEKKTESTTEKVTTEEKKTESTTEKVTTEEKKTEATTEKVTTEEKKTEATTEKVTTEEKKTEATTEDNTEEEMELVAPQNLTVTRLTPFQVKLTWDEVEGAKAYRLKYAEGVVLSMCEKTVFTNEVILDNLKPGEVCYYYVAAIYGEDGEADVISEFSGYVKWKNYELDFPKLTNCTLSDDQTEVTFTISVDEDRSMSAHTNSYITNILLYGYVDEEECVFYKKLDAREETVTFVGLKPGKEYSFYAYYECERGVTIYQSGGKAITFETEITLEQPKNLAVTSISPMETKITWDAVENANVYILSCESAGEITQSEYTETEALLTDLVPGRSHYFSIQAVCRRDGKEDVVSEVSDTLLYKKERLAAPVVEGYSLSEDNSEITFNVIPDIYNDELLVYGKKEGDEKYTRMNTVEASASSITCEGLEPGQMYDFYFCYWIRINKKIFSSQSSEHISVKTQINEKNLKAPENVTIRNENPFEVSLNWKKNNYATGYEVTYWAEGAEPVTKAVQTYYATITDLQPGTQYSYYVCTVYEDEQGKVVSEKSEVITNQNEAVMKPVISGYTYDEETEKLSLDIDASEGVDTLVYVSMDGVDYARIPNGVTFGGGAYLSPVMHGYTYYIKVLNYRNNRIYQYSDPIIVTTPKKEVSDAELIAQDGRPQAGNTYEAHIMAYEVLDLMNAERVRVGSDPCAMDSRYLQVAGTRAQEITILYSHQRPQGGNWYSAYTELGYRPGFSAENIMWGCKSSTAFYNAWKNSPGHYRNMTNNTYKYVGIYIYQNPINGCYYAVQNFAKQ